MHITEVLTLDEHHLAILKDLDRRLFPSCEEAIKEQATWWIAWEDGIPVGFAGLGLIKRGKVGCLVRVGVLKKYRGKGIQKEFIRLRMERCQSLNVKMVTAYTANWNYASANNLISQGFRLYGPKGKVAGAQAGWLYFRKILQTDEAQTAIQ